MHRSSLALPFLLVICTGLLLQVGAIKAKPA